MLVYLSNPSDLREGAGHSCLNSTQERINPRDTWSLDLIKITSGRCLLVVCFLVNLDWILQLGPDLPTFLCLDLRD